MKGFLITGLLTIQSVFIFGQNDYGDSLKTALAATTDPYIRFDLTVKILENEDVFQGNKVDSLACASLLKIAQEQRSDAMLATAYNWIGYYLVTMRMDNTAGLEYYFKALPLAEKTNDKRRISSLCFDIAGIYAVLQNQQEFLRYTVLGGKNLPDKSSPMHDYMLVQYQRNMANYFLRSKQYDSASFYGLSFSQTSLRLNAINFLYQATVFNADLNSKMGKNEDAEIYFTKARAISDSLKDEKRKALFYGMYIRYLLSNDRIQEAKQEIQQLWEIAKRSDKSNLKMTAAGFKKVLFDKLHQTDSAYYFSKIEADNKESIFNQNNLNVVQALAFKEQLRSIEDEGRRTAYQNKFKQYGLIGGLGVFFVIAFLLFLNNRQKQKANIVLQATLADLKSTQSQLIQSEKMASLGELTAGIAHEIQNPLNFVNNFSEVNSELISEMKDELSKGNINDAKAIADTIDENEKKIMFHGKRADGIVKGMLQHSRSSSGIKEPTAINALADEYLRLAYHGLRAKDKTFNASMKTEFDERIGNVNIIPQDIGRVILNLITNAFYAVSERLRQAQPDSGYEPTVTVSTKKLGDKILISVKDNGNGILDSIKEKIFQPFFTTKPTGQGTGLGLSLSYDIVKAHGGELKVETKEGEGSTFVIQLPTA